MIKSRKKRAGRAGESYIVQDGKAITGWKEDANKGTRKKPAEENMSRTLFYIVEQRGRK